MPECTWTYLLPTGEKLEARLDVEGDVESVYLGPRLVSRCAGRSGRSGRNESGHLVELMHRDAAGPFRGGSKARVVFGAAPPSCVVTVDDRLLEPSEVPPVAQKDVPPDAVVVHVPTPRASRPVLLAILLALVGGGAAVIVADQHYRMQAIGAEPLTEKAVSPNGLLRIHYSRDFRPTVRRMPSPAGDVVELVRDGHAGGILMLAIPHTTRDAAGLEGELATGETEPWAPRGTKLVDGAGTVETCFDVHAVTKLRVATIDGRHFHVWSCTFVRDGHGYRFVTFAPDHADRDHAVLRRIVLATELL